MPSQDTSTGYAQLFQENHFKCKSRSDKMIHFWLQSASDREAGQFAVRPNFLSEKKWCTLNLKPHKICVVSELQITSHRLQFLKVMFRYFLLNKWQYLFHFHSPFNNRTEAKKKRKKKDLVEIASLFFYGRRNCEKFTTTPSTQVNGNNQYFIVLEKKMKIFSYILMLGAPGVRGIRL